MLKTPIVEAENRLGKRSLCELKGWSHCELNDPAPCTGLRPQSFGGARGPCLLQRRRPIPNQETKAPALLPASRTPRG